MTLAPTELARRSPEAIAYRHDAVRLSMVFHDLVAADGHTLDVHATLPLRVREEPADLELFKEQFLAGAAEPRVSIDDVRSRLTLPLRSSLAEFVTRHDAAACLKQRDTLAALLLQRANEIGFGCGIEFLAPVQVEVSSDSLAATAARARMVTDRERQVEQTVRLANLLRDVPPHLLPVDQQAAHLGPLLTADETAPHTLYIVAGPKLATVDAPTRQVRPIELGHDIGPLRCARVLQIDGQPRLAMGGQRGLSLADGPAYPIETASERGFNSIAWHSPTRRLVAAHGELGLATWSLDAPAAGPETFAAPPQARHLLAIDERLLFSAGAEVLVFDGQSIRPISLPGRATLLGLLDVGGDVLAIREDGTMQRLDSTTLGVRSEFRHPEPLAAAAAVTGGGLRLLALVRQSGSIDLVTVSGEPVGQIVARGAPARMLACVGRWIIAASPDRGSLLAWDAAALRTAPLSISILGALGHRVADLLSAPPLPTGS